MKLRHYTIPVFVPEEACPNRCVFCNQHTIAGAMRAPLVEEVVAKVEQHLQTIKPESEVEIGFFGGNFTGISKPLQENYLQAVQPYIVDGRVQGIRLSTRPDYIDEEHLRFLKNYKVQSIELGAQSMDEEVLRYIGRGHTGAQVREASALIKAQGFKLGLQMMIGLPGDTAEKTIFTAQEIIGLGADFTRIYPTLVIKNTELAAMYQNGSYKPLTLQQAIEHSAAIVPLFVRAGVKILRLGLHPSEELLDGTGILAGPFDVAFGEKVYSKVWEGICKQIITRFSDRQILQLQVAPGMRNAAFGHKAANKNLLLNYFNKFMVEENETLKGFEYEVVS